MRSVNLTDTLTLPPDVFLLKNNDFYSFIRDSIGETIESYLKFLSIDSVECLLRIDDIFSFISIDSPEFSHVKNKVAFQLNDGTFVVRPGFKNVLYHFIERLRNKQEYYNSRNDDSEQKEEIFKTVQHHSLLRSLVSFYQQFDNAHDISISFLSCFIETITENLKRSKNHYSYSKPITDFAISLYVLGGRTTYEFVHANLGFALPSITTLNQLIEIKSPPFVEAEFRFEPLAEIFRSHKVTYAFGSEDCTGVVKDISYDVKTNSFIGFASPLDEGIPHSTFFQTDSFEELKRWFNSVEKANLLNVHMIQPIPQNIQFGSANILAAYGVTSSYDSVDILKRWLYIYDQFKKRDIRIIGFSTDCDLKYLRSMKLVLGFFAQLPNINFSDHHDCFQINIPDQWSWFFLRQKQLLLFFQDATHLSTKWRNRLLSDTADLTIGNKKIDISHLVNIVKNNHSKLDHALVMSDIDPSDRQDYTSCEKISSDEVLAILKSDVDSYATFLYVKLLRYIIDAYINENTSIKDRLYFSWTIVFVCRLWKIWLNIKFKTSTRKIKDKYFITDAAYYSIEINAHTLLYLILLVDGGGLPLESLQISLFSSQPCESIFRSARSLTGTQSTMVNFDVKDFLHRAEKLTVLQNIKSQQNQNQPYYLQFPKHRKHRKNCQQPMICSQSLNATEIETIIVQAFKHAQELVSKLDVNILLQKNNLYELRTSSIAIYNSLKQSNRLIDLVTSNLFLNCDLNLNKDEDCDSSSINNKENYSGDSSTDNDNDESDNILQSNRNDFSGMRIFDTIDSTHRNSYFEVKINGNNKFLHKETACWLLKENSNHLSSDRLSRVKQTSR